MAVMDHVNYQLDPKAMMGSKGPFSGVMLVFLGGVWLLFNSIFTKITKINRSNY